MRYLLLCFRSLVCPNRNNRRTTANYRPYQSSLSGCRFGRSGSSGFVDGFCRLRLSRLVVQIVEVVLYFAVGQFAVDQVAGAVVVIGRAVVGFKAVEYVVGKAVARTVFICDS